VTKPGTITKTSTIKTKAMDEKDIYHWIAGIIDSCKHDFQLECAGNLVELFAKRTENNNLLDDLRMKIDTKFAVIHGL
jgi:hypothetical protein